MLYIFVKITVLAFFTAEGKDILFIFRSHTVLLSTFLSAVYRLISQALAQAMQPAANGDHAVLFLSMNPGSEVCADSLKT
jgi:hypothetical protein